MGSAILVDINSACWVIYHSFLLCAVFIVFFSQKFYFQKLLSGIQGTIRVSQSPDQAQPFVMSDLGPYCLQRLSADSKSRH